MDQSEEIIKLETIGIKFQSAPHVDLGFGECSPTFGITYTLVRRSFAYSIFEVAFLGHCPNGSKTFAFSLNVC